MILSFTQRISDDSVYVAMEAENLDSMMRSRSSYAGQSIARASFSLKPVSINGVIAGITHTVGQVRFDYIGNLKKVNAAVDVVDQ
ncbi:hypothetical protein Pmar_PMAR020452 [Perkinsus marinus ATCC 50983]|nr:hypothetical protein Pmar_PMAR020452 [Perkinsus marinus ATCC 50983]EER07291.1 hypothetical protein Pmar_PMAR020452 [Perkinsus marinus ATCC 50983]|eukprot:XP_002775475.1 hypothetical protein Pmar_PMAR020452 [Perkinsus marinus ATCC 50983]